MTLATVTQAGNSDSIRSIFPGFTDRRKVDYLVLRSVNFTTEEALRVLKMQYIEYEEWCAYDRVFVDWEMQKLREIQKHIGAEVLRTMFMRNVFLQLAIDSELLARRMSDPEALTAQERSEVADAAKRYSAPSIQAMSRVLEPDLPSNSTDDRKIHFVIEVTGSDLEQYTQRKVQARKLLQDFTSRDVVIDEEGNLVEELP